MTKEIPVIVVRQVDYPMSVVDATSFRAYCEADTPQTPCIRHLVKGTVVMEGYSIVRNLRVSFAIERRVTSFVLHCLVRRQNEDWS